MCSVALVGACARQGAPPGGPVDRRPPVVVSTVPDTFAVDTTFRGPVRFKFDERISERPAAGTMDQAVVVSPESGEVKVSHHRSGLEIKMAGGFKRGVVYTVTLLPVIRDMFNNRMHDPFELVFSTGAPFVNSAVVGMVWNRITGAPLKDMEVTAVPRADSTRTYVARSDTAGIYAFRYLPPGHYRITAFDDRNGNGRLDPTEPRGRDSLILSGPDTILPVNVATLQPDTAPARVKGAVALDSVTVLVSLDHYVDPAEPDSDITASLSSDSVSAPGVARIYQEYGYTRWVTQFRDSVQRADSVAAAAAAKAAAAKAAAAKKAPEDTTVRDTTAARADTIRSLAPAPAPASRKHLPPLLPGATGGAAAGRARMGGGVGGAGAGLGPDGKPLPKQRIVLLLDSALVPGVAYKVRVRGVLTVNGVPMDGGDTARVTLPVPKDTAKAAPDTGKAAKDTTKAAKDTAKAVNDTTRAAKDTTRVPGALRVPTFAALPERRGGGR